MKLRPYVGSGGRKSSTPTNTPDNLYSQDVFEMSLAYGEGVFYGLVNGLKSFYVSGTPLQAEDGAFNFQDLAISFRQGYADDLPIHYLQGGESSNIPEASGVGLAYGVVRDFTTDPALRGLISMLQVRIAVQMLYSGDSKGNTGYSSADLHIKYRKVGTPDWTYIGNLTEKVWAGFSNGFISPDPNIYRISGKTTSGYITEVTIPLDPNPTGDWEIQIENLTPDYTPAQQTTNGRKLGIDNIAMVTANDSQYDDTVVAQIIAQATDRFTSVPDFTAEFYALMVNIPTNYNPFTHTYDGAWDGTYKMGWTNNPVWITREVIMNNRWGLRLRQPNIMVTESNFYQMAQYCDEQVPNMDGSTSPRHTYNDVVKTTQSLQDYLTYLCGSYNAIVLERLGVYSLYVDKPKTCNFFICPETTVLGSMVYSKTDLSTRYNTVRPTYSNADHDYQSSRFLMSDPASIAKYGVIEYAYNVVGCTNYSEAVRSAAYVILTNRDEQTLLQFTSPRLGILASMYDHFYVAHREAGFGHSARILSISGNTITLRDPIVKTTGSYKITWHTSSGLVSANATTPDQYTLVLDSTANASWLFVESPIMIEGGSYGNAQEFRLASVKEAADSGSGVPAGTLYSFSAIRVSSDKYSIIDNIFTDTSSGLTFDNPNPVIPKIRYLSPPTGITISMVDPSTNGGKVQYNYSFNPVSGADSYTIYWTNDVTGEERQAQVSSASGVLDNAFSADGTPITFSIFATNVAGLISTAGILKSYAPYFEVDISLPSLISIGLVNTQVVAVWESEPSNMPAYDRLMATYSAPDGSSGTIQLTKGATTASFPYVGQGIYQLQLEYQIGTPTQSVIDNETWMYTAPDIPPLITPILGTVYSSVNGMIKDRAPDSGNAYVAFDCQLIDAATNPILSDNSDPIQVQYEQYFGTGVYQDATDQFFLQTLDSTHFRVLMVQDIMIGKKIQFRSAAASLSSAWVTLTVPAPSGDLPSKSPADIYLDAVAGI